MNREAFLLEGIHMFPIESGIRSVDIIIKRCSRNTTTSHHHDHHYHCHYHHHRHPQPSNGHENEECVVIMLMKSICRSVTSLHYISLSNTAHHMMMMFSH